MVHLKDFPLLSPTIQSSDVLKAIEIAIPATAIEQAIATAKASEQRNWSQASTISSLPANCNELVVES